MKLSLSDKAAICAFVMLTAVFLNFIIPPFQYPDEPLHFGLILSYAGWKENPEIEKDIIKWMDHFNWWKHIGMGRPQELPDRFSDIRIFNFRSYRTHFRRLTAFHHYAGGFLRFIGCRDTLASYYLCRLLSLLAVIGAWMIIFSIFIRLSRTLDTGLIAAPFFLLFLPQLHLLSLAVNPDAGNVLLGAAFFYVVLRAIPTGKNYQLFLLLPMAVLGLFIDESSFVLFALMLLFPFIFLLSGSGEKKWIWAAVSAAALGFLVIWTSWFFPLVYFDFLRLIRQGIIRNLPEFWNFFSFTPFHFRFFNLLEDSFLFQFGWMVFRTHKIFYLIWKAALALSFSGIILLLLKTARNRRSGNGSSEKNRITVRIILFFLAALTIQIIGLWMDQGTQGVLPQGRYFMLLIIPISMIFCLGIGALFQRIPGFSGKKILIVFILIEFFFLNFCIWNEIIPVYFLRILSPHPGV